jgi:hypothetical protein
MPVTSAVPIGAKASYAKPCTNNDFFPGPPFVKSHSPLWRVLRFSPDPPMSLVGESGSFIPLRDEAKPAKTSSPE